MISNLPLLFADGYPTCLEKFTVRQLERFIPFMLQCSLGVKFVDRFTPVPNWWPEDVPFSSFMIKPDDMDDTRWYANLKSVVCRCYTYHGCEFMLRFCTELSAYPASSYEFVETWDGTTSLYNKDSKRLMVTFRNENREYDKDQEANLQQSLFPKNTTQRQIFDIYLCDNCDGEFDCFADVQEHEKICPKRSLYHDSTLEETCKEAFLEYFKLKPLVSEERVPDKSPVKKGGKKRYPAGISFTRCCSIPFSSPLGLSIQRKSRMATINPQILLDRMERYCVDKSSASGPRHRESEDKSQENIEWPVTWKPPNPKKGQEDWSHHYCFTRRESRLKLAGGLKAGLNKRSRQLLSRCRDVQVTLKRLNEEEIARFTSRRRVLEPTPLDEIPTFFLPTLLPNTVYTYSTKYNSKNKYSSEIEIAPEQTLIDLCSENEDEMEVEVNNENVNRVVSLMPMPVMDSEENALILNEDKYFQQNENVAEEEDHQVFCDKNNVAVYPFVDTSSYNSYSQAEISSDDDTMYAVQYSGDPSASYSTSIPHSWQMKICIKTPSPSPASSCACEEDSAYPSHLNCNKSNIPNSEKSSSQRKETNQKSNFNRASGTFTHGLNKELFGPLLQYNTTNDPKLFNSHVPLYSSRIKTETTLHSVPSHTSTSLLCQQKDDAISAVSYLQKKEQIQASSSSHPQTTTLCYIPTPPRSECSKLTLNRRNEQTRRKLCSSASSASDDDDDQSIAHLTLYQGNEPIESGMLSIVPHVPVAMFPNENTPLHGDVLSMSQCLESKGSEEFQKILNTSSSSTYLNGKENSASYDSRKYDNLMDQQKACNSELSFPSRRERLRSKTLPAPPLLEPAPNFAQEGDETAYDPLHCDSINYEGLHHSEFSHRRRSRSRFTAKRAYEEPEVIVIDSDTESKKSNLQVYGEPVSPVDSSIQDTSNNDQLKHEKATESLQRRLVKRRLPLSIHRLHQDECRELRRSGLHDVMNTNRRMLCKQTVEEDNFAGTCCPVREPVKVGNLSRRGRVVNISLKDNEVEFVNGTVTERNKYLEGLSCGWSYSNKKYGEKNNKGINSILKKDVSKRSERKLTTHFCPSLKCEKRSKPVHMDTYALPYNVKGNVKCNSGELFTKRIGRWSSVDYSSHVVVFRVEEPGQSLHYSSEKKSTNSVERNIVAQSCKRKFMDQVKQNYALRSETKLTNEKSDLYCSTDSSLQTKTRLTEFNCHSATGRETNCCRCDNLFQTEGRLCSKRRKLNYVEECKKVSLQNFKMLEKCKPKYENLPIVHSVSSEVTESYSGLDNIKSCNRSSRSRFSNGPSQNVGQVPPSYSCSSHLRRSCIRPSGRLC